MYKHHYSGFRTSYDSERERALRDGKTILSDENSIKFVNIILKDDENELTDFISTIDNIDSLFSVSSKKIFDILRVYPTLLSVACFFKAFKCVRLLIDCGANVDARDYFGRICQHFAVAGGSMEIIRLLDTNDSWPQVTDNTNQSCMHYACDYGQLEVVHYLWSKGVPLDSQGGYYAEHPINLAALNGHLPIVEFLISKGVSPNTQGVNQHFHTIHFACQGGHADIVKYLISIGVKFRNSQDDSSAIVAAAKSGSLEVIKVLAEADAQIVTPRRSQQPFIEAARGGHIDVVQYFLQQGIDVNIVTSDGETALFAAIQNGDAKMVKFLLKHDASPWLYGRFGTPFEEAVRKGDMEIIKLFEENLGDDYADFLQEEDKCVYYAVKKGDVELVKYLFDKGAKITKVFDTNQSSGVRHDISDEIFSYPIANHNLEMVKLLVENGALEVEYKQRPIEYAIDSGDVNIMNYLIENGDDIKTAFNHNNDIIQLAASSGSFECFKAVFTVLDPILNSGRRKKRFGENMKFKEKLIILAIERMNSNCGYRRSFNRFNRFRGFQNTSKDIEENCVKIIEFIINFYKFPIKDNIEILENAICSGSSMLVKMFIDLGADFNIRVHKTISRKPRFFGMLYRSDDEEVDYPIYFTIFSKNIIDSSKVDSVYDLLIESGIDVMHETDSLGRNILMNIIKTNYLNNSRKTIKYFVQKGSDLNHCSSLNESALSIAVELFKGRVVFNGFGRRYADESTMWMIKYLLKNGADPNIGLVDEMPIFSVIASIPKSIYLMQLMLRKGVNLDAFDVQTKADFIKSKHPLIVALIANNMFAVEVILQNLKEIPNGIKADIAEMASAYNINEINQEIQRLCFDDQ
ncbi:serine/threonine-protein phosphatase 6 regulatory ankyrin repeat subunit A-like [Histomonas meleagridis]|uniref:serine/threonine-protein phosphatase 6 regulatory ankyrin repeat subunit A-like n=1 Tax=Histomonas meleagridis TaxID=135588 RepID=UPI00355A777C|nr:serine/threonine-protein phosphatase 6 regulatory ankyrin repeat subunit A-like [Histomonas meleagridis]KAH0806581.1 serine/threonine-protein phosphatase 6 regulatory ankyrin repeat subunit A-like [Histomonas meleagridis]